MLWMLIGCSTGAPPKPAPEPIAATPPEPAPPAKVYKSPDEKTGWGGLEWGSAPPKDGKCYDLSRTGQPRSSGCTRPKADDKHIGQIEIEPPLYLYFDNKLETVILTPRYSDYDPLIASLTETYGPPGGLDAIPSWDGEKVNIRGLNVDGVPRTISYSCTAIKDEARAAKEARQKSAAGDL